MSERKEANLLHAARLSVLLASCDPLDVFRNNGTRLDLLSDMPSFIRRVCSASILFCVGAKAVLERWVMADVDDILVLQFRQLISVITPSQFTNCLAVGRVLARHRPCKLGQLTRFQTR